MSSNSSFDLKFSDLIQIGSHKLCQNMNTINHIIKLSVQNYYNSSVSITVLNLMFHDKT